MSTIVFPSDPEGVTPALLTAALAERHSGVVVERVRVLATAHCDSGSASTAGRVVIELDYADGRDGGLPRQLVLKTMLVRPGAPAAMYENEVRFYRDLRPEVPVETPQAYASVFDPASGQFGVLMEDVTLRGASFPNATTSLDRAGIGSLLEQLAALHAHWWQSPRFAGDLAWLWTPHSGGFYDVIRPHGRTLIGHLIETSGYKRSLLRRLGRSLEDLWTALWRAQAILATEPATLLHGDCHFGNTYRLGDGTVGLLDWQLMQRGRWAHDVTYVLVTALTSTDRRADERALLAHYLDALRNHGVTTVPSFDAAWLLHRQTAIWGLVIGWLLCPTENYGETILQANLERLATAVEELETFEALGC